MPSYNVAADDEPQAFGGGHGVSDCDLLDLPQYSFLADSEF
jgi:hypothetical protein